MQYILPIIVLFFVLRFLIKKYRKKRVEAFPIEWEKVLYDCVKFYRTLNNDKQAEFKQRMMVFLSEVNIDAIKFELTDKDRILIAASAIIPVFGFESWNYNYLDTVILYPNSFNENLYFDKGAKGRNIAGMVGSGIYEGKMILSRKALHHGFENSSDKKNTAIHEFVHLIDKEDGKIDGLLEHLLDHEYAIPWLDLIHTKMDAINNDKSDIRSYGGTSQVEFLAVAAEYFFERPELMEKKHPELFKMLQQCFFKRSA